MIDTLNRALEVPSTDPDDARRRKLLNILLLGVALLTSLMLGALVVTYITGVVTTDTLRELGFGTIALFLGFTLTFVINRYGAGWLASSLFLLLLTGVFSFADEPRQVVEGRSTFLLTIPVLMASVILRPWASFAVAGLSSLVISIIAFVRLEDYAQGTPPFPTMLGFFAFAFISWLSARSLENALKDLRALNRELDQRVEDRTKALREANRQLAEANERLRELDRLKSRFVSMVSHELRTPLSAVQGFAEMLLAEIYGPLSERQTNALERITSNTKRLLHLINDLLDQARIEAGQIALQPHPFSPDDLVEEVQSTMGMLASSEGLELTTEVATDVPDTLHGDEKRLHQILVNLINNAIKFTDEGGVDVRIYRPDGQLRGYWGMEVSDTGPGISEEDQERIFDPFQRVDNSSTREHLGVGLGLSIVKELVDLMGGRLALESEIGEGSTFTILLPLHQQGGTTDE